MKNKHKLFAKVENGIITAVKTADFNKDGYCDIEIGEQDSRHYHEPISDDYGYLYKLVDGKMVERTQVERADEIAQVEKQNEISQIEAKLVKVVYHIIDIMTPTQRNKLPNWVLSDFTRLRELRGAS